MRTEHAIPFDDFRFKHRAQCQAVGIDLAVSDATALMMERIANGKTLTAAYLPPARIIAATAAATNDPVRYLAGLLEKLETHALLEGQVIDYAFFNGFLPGSPESTSSGCICDKRLNNGGLGWRDTFSMDPRCPLHGYPPAL